jgi:protein PhnA
MLYLDGEVQEWAEGGEVRGTSEEAGGSVVHRDSNGAVLGAGDTVTLFKDLNVKGAGSTANEGPRSAIFHSPMTTRATSRAESAVSRS